MSIRILTKRHSCSLLIMFSRCISSLYRSIGQTCSKKKYHLLTNSVLVNHNKLSLSNIIQELSSTFGLALFLFYLFYQLFGNLILIVFIIYGILCM
jgi:hypothetical protein